MNLLALKASILTVDKKQQKELYDFICKYRTLSEKEVSILKDIPATVKNYNLIQRLRKHIAREMYLYDTFYPRHHYRVALRLKARGPRKPEKHWTGATVYNLGVFEAERWSLYAHQDWVE